MKVTNPTGLSKRPRQLAERIFRGICYNTNLTTAERGRNSSDSLRNFVGFRIVCNERKG